MTRVGISKGILFAGVIAAVAGMSSQAQAVPITFASFQQTNSGATSWVFTNAGAASTFQTVVGGVAVNFQGSPPPNQILDFINLFNGTNGSVTATLDASVFGTATNVAGTITQNLAAGGHLKFVDTSNPSDVILDLIFTGAITGSASGTGSVGASTLAGQAIVYSSNHLAGGAAFNTPFLFSLTIDTPLSINGNGYLDSFTTSSTGSFRADSSGASPVPLPAAAWGGMSMLSAIGGIGAFIRRRRGR